MKDPQTASCRPCPWGSPWACLALCTVTLLAALCQQPAVAQFSFLETSAPAGIEPYTMILGKGGGVAAADFDDDGYVDFFVPNSVGVPDQLYRNTGSGTFEEIAADVGLNYVGASRVALWFDYDADRHLDLVVANDCRERLDPCEPTIRLYRQVSPTEFQDVTPASGLLEGIYFRTNTHLGGLSAGDINNDGYLDLLMGEWIGRTQVWLNRGDGTLNNISDHSGLNIEQVQHYQHVLHDFDRDGWQDIYTAFDSGPNFHWINQHDNSFINVALEVGTTQGWNGMGITLGDYDNDGLFDIYRANITHNRLYRNISSDGTLLYDEVGTDAGVRFAEFAWGTTFLDADNDGLLDLAVTNGWENKPWQDDRSFLYRNTGGDPVTFEDVSATVGFNDDLWGSSLVAFDYDRDGALDLVQTTLPVLANPSRLRLLRNQLGPEAALNNYIVVKPRQQGPNYHAIGAVIRAQIGETTLSRLITAGTSFLGQEPAEAHFGLGTAQQVDALTIEWPNGFLTRLTDVSVNQVLTVHSPHFDSDNDGVSDTNEVAFGTDPLNASSTPALPAQHPWALALSLLLLVTALHARRETPKR